VLRDWLEESDVRVAATAPATGRTSTARVSWDEERNASYDFDLAWDVDATALAAAGEAEAVHIGSIATVLEPGADAVERFVAERRSGALVSFDPNARPTITPDREAVVPRVERLVALSDVVKMSDEDLGWYYPGVPAVEAAKRLLGGAGHDGPIVMAVTLGGDGVLLLRGDDEVRVPAPKVTVADTIAAGDTFTAALIDALLTMGASGPGARERLLALDEDELREAAAWAAAAAAITVSRAGANPPTREELLAAR
jgi:fructokinase